jgi:hypothetical protein
MELPGSDNGRQFIDWHEFCFYALSKASGIFGRLQKIRMADSAQHLITENPGDYDGRKSPEDDQRQ